MTTGIEIFCRKAIPCDDCRGYGVQIIQTAGPYSDPLTDDLTKSLPFKEIPCSFCGGRGRVYVESYVPLDQILKTTKSWLRENS